MKVHVDVDYLKGTNEALKESINNFATKKYTLRYNIDDLAGKWNDAGYVTFRNSMQDFFTELYKMQHSLDTYTDFIDSYTDSLKAFDEKFSGKDINLN